MVVKKLSYYNYSPRCGAATGMTHDDFTATLLHGPHFVKQISTEIMQRRHRLQKNTF